MAAKSEDTRKKILEAALRMFRERGFQESTMREIAQEAKVATGLAYYYFPKKEDLVMAFYVKVNAEMRPMVEAALSAEDKLEQKIRALVHVKLDYFAPDRKFLGALSGYSADPGHRLSPFSEETKEIREEGIEQFRVALDRSEVKVPEDLALALPKILWMYQMGMVLFWIYDRSEGQRRTQLLLEKSLGIVVLLLKAALLPLMRPVRKLILDLVDVIEGNQNAVQ
jgi:AcrR family transcriptional regulator